MKTITDGRGIYLDVDSFDTLTPISMFKLMEYVREKIDSIHPGRVLKNIFVTYAREEKHPFCALTDNDVYVIGIYAKGYDEYQWLYQFAHEYMHLFIGNIAYKPQGKNGLWWFEETLCSLSSLYHYYRYMSEIPNANLISDSENKDKVQQLRPDSLLPCEDPLQMNLESLRDIFRLPQCVTEPLPEYNPLEYEYYNACAKHLLRLFLEHPQYWNIVLYMRNVRSFENISSFIDWLENHLSEEYQSLKPLILVLRNVYMS